jgi:hypothetical protein
MTFALAVLAFALVVALLVSERTSRRERQDMTTSHGEQMTRLVHSHRLEMQALRALLDEQIVTAAQERTALIDRFHIPAAKQIALAAPPWLDEEGDLPEPPPSPDSFAFDEDDYVAALMAPITE